MSIFRSCSQTGCSRPAAATLTYVYAEATAVLGPVAAQAQPHAYDLCAEHAQSLSAPKGWQIVRLISEYVPAPVSPDDLDAIANAIREASQSQPRPTSSAPSYKSGIGKPKQNPPRPHLQIVRDYSNGDSNDEDKRTNGGTGRVGSSRNGGDNTDATNCAGSLPLN